MYQKKEVKFIDFKREWNYFRDDFIRVFSDFGENGVYVLGKYTEDFEADFANYCHHRYCSGLSSGLSALEAALKSANVLPGDEVITVANSAVATALAISNVGAQPVFCDVGQNFLIDADKIESLITNRTKAILPVHLFGRICDIESINLIANKHNLRVVEDACQAHGASFDNFINVKAFSFYPTKNLGALGEGGAIVTDDENVYNFISSYRNYGQRERYNHVMLGNNYRISALQCALLDIKLKKLDGLIGKRRSIAKRYIEELKGFDQLIIDDYNPNWSYHLFVIRIKDNLRDLLQKYLKEAGIDTIVHYPVAIHKQPCYSDIGNLFNLDMTDKFQNEILSLPCYPFLLEDEQAYVIDSIKSYFINNN